MGNLGCLMKRKGNASRNYLNLIKNLPLLYNARAIDMRFALDMSLRTRYALHARKTADLQSCKSAVFDYT